MTVCVSANFTTPAGVLTRAGHVSPQIVWQQGFNSTPSSTNFLSTPATSLPGITFLDQTITCPANSTGTKLNYFVYVLYYSRTMDVGSPNAIQFRDSYEYTLDGSTPPLPDVERTLRSEEGFGIDRGTTVTAGPLCNIAGRELPRREDMFHVYAVESGQQLKVRFRSIVWTPPPFSNNGGTGPPGSVCWGPVCRTNSNGGMQVTIMAFPTVNELI